MANKIKVILLGMLISQSINLARAMPHMNIGNDTVKNENAQLKTNAAAFHEIVDKIRDNVNNPLPCLRTGSYLTDSERAIRQYVRQLALNSSMLDSIKQQSLSEQGNTKIWLDISLGFLSDSSVHGLLYDIILYNADHNIRAMAISALASYGDTSDLPIIHNALKDTAFVRVNYDFGVDGENLLHQDIYPVRMEAIQALKKFGYDVMPDTINGDYLVKEKK